MLNDPSRKLLRILQNFSSLNGRPPTMQELVRKTGRTIGQIKMTLRVLAVEGYIEWQPKHHHQLKVTQGWEIIPKYTKNAGVNRDVSENRGDPSHNRFC